MSKIVKDIKVKLIETKTDATEAKAGPVKAKKEFKGDIINLQDLSRTPTVPIIVQRIDKVRTNAPYYQSKDTLKRFLVLHKVTKNGYSNSYSINTESIENPSYQNQSTVPDTFKFKKLMGRMGLELQKKYQENKVKNLSGVIGGPLSKEIGSDPEIFLEDDKGIIPAFDFLKGKNSPNTFSHGNIYWDGFQAEFTLKADPCMGWIADRLQFGLKAMYQLAKAHNPNARFSTKTLIELSPQQLQETKTEHIEFGCRPSFNAYGLKADLDKDPRTIPYRSSGGHIHFGIGKQSEEVTREIIKSLDAILGVGCVSLFAKYDHPLRRRYYGLPGEYRLPAHGIEYRVLSNAWIFHPAVANVVFDLGRKICNFGYHKFLEYWKSTEEETIGTIINCDVDKARDILNRNKELFTKLFRYSYSETGVNEVVKMFSNGMESAIHDPSNIVDNWDLNATWKTHCDGPNKNWTRASISISQGIKV